MFSKTVVILSLLIRTLYAKSASEIKDASSPAPHHQETSAVIAQHFCNNAYSFIKVDQKQCVRNFLDSKNTLNGAPSRLELKCQNKDILQFKVDPQPGLRQMVLLDPTFGYTNETPKKIMMPNESIAVLEWYSDSHYTAWTVVVADNGTRSAWQRGIDIKPYEDTTSNLTDKYHITYEIPYGFANSELKVSGKFTWDQYDGLDNCFDYINSCSGPYYSYCTRVMGTIGPDHNRSIIINDLLLGVKYNFMINGKYGSSDVTYYVPVVAYTEKNVKITMPTQVENVSLSVVPLENKTWNIQVSWEQRQKHDMYKLVLRLSDGETRNTTVSGNVTAVLFDNVVTVGRYSVTIDAVLSGYSNVTNVFGEVKDAAGLGGASALSAWGAGGAVRAAGGAGVALVLAGALLITVRLIRTRNKTKGHNLFDILDLNASHFKQPSPEKEMLVSDEWEVDLELLQLHEVIGEGAFGVVRRGVLAPTGKEVAVKMLKDFPTVEEVRSFRAESELMKSVGAHKHVVSLVGCCSGRLYILAEFCSQGDLLTYLRRSWDLMVKKRNAKYYNFNPADYRNDLFKTHSKGQVVSNKLYELEGVCEAEITFVDVLSFCRQIAIGMEFLASNRVVHRDLAGRNVLVSADKTLKIADFGLSRDVYQDNQYKQKGDGKMPIKWMAIESLLHKIYTTQSDVWSFGVVIWEVVTLGGTPYPGLSAARLLRLLRAGYRMPCPVNCTKSLYEVMLSCWEPHASSRPSFAALHARLDALLHAATADQYLALTKEYEDPALPIHATTVKYLDVFNRAWQMFPRARVSERPLPAANVYSSPPAADGLKKHAYNSTRTK